MKKKRNLWKIYLEILKGRDDFGDIHVGGIIM
jgi:hypothetical protein